MLFVNDGNRFFGGESLHCGLTDCLLSQGSLLFSVSAAVSEASRKLTCQDGETSRGSFPSSPLLPLHGVAFWFLCPGKRGLRSFGTDVACLEAEARPLSYGKSLQCPGRHHQWVTTRWNYKLFCCFCWFLFDTTEKGIPDGLVFGVR